MLKHYKLEVLKMEEFNRRVEIEALPDLPKFVRSKILTKDFL